MSRRLLQVLAIVSSTVLAAAFIAYRAGWWAQPATNAVAVEPPATFPGSKSMRVMETPPGETIATPPAVEPAVVKPVEATVLPGSKSFQVLPLDEERAEPAIKEPKDVMWSTKSAPVFTPPSPGAPETPASEPAEAEPILIK